MANSNSLKVANAFVEGNIKMCEYSLFHYKVFIMKTEGFDMRETPEKNQTAT